MTEGGDPAGRTRVAYEALPELFGLGVRHSWGHGSAATGALGQLTPQSVLEALSTVTVGRVTPLNYAVDEFDPPLFGRGAVAHRVHSASRNDFEDILDSFNPQSSSQLDGLGHVRAREAGFYGGITDPVAAGEALGIHHIAAQGIVTRGVLVDLPRHRAAEGRACDPFAGEPIFVDEVLSALDGDGIALRSGDVLLVRTGWADAYLAAQRSGSPTAVLQANWNGLSGDERTAAFLWDSGVVAVGADNPAVEDAPGSAERGSLHRRLLPALGISLFELLALNALADVCAEVGRREFLFVSVPLPVRGGVSSPANALAVL